ncbi:MAG: GNAT family N-acetyltransferase [Ignavibacteriaceae bacterium]
MDVFIRTMKQEDFESVRNLQKKVYPHLKPWSIEQLENHSKVFSKGQIVAELNGEIVGTASSLIIFWEEYGRYHNWGEVTGMGTFNTHTPEGKTLYGAEVCVNPSFRKKGIGQKIYAERRNICKAYNLKRIISAGRLPNYHLYADKMKPHDYAMHVIWGDIYDPVLRFQIKQGFQFCGIVENYLPGDKESLEFATLIVWLNPDYKETLNKGDFNEGKNSSSSISI